MRSLVDFVFTISPFPELRQYALPQGLGTGTSPLSCRNRHRLQDEDKSVQSSKSGSCACGNDDWNLSCDEASDADARVRNRAFFQGMHHDLGTVVDKHAFEHQPQLVIVYAGIKFAFIGNRVGYTNPFWLFYAEMSVICMGKLALEGDEMVVFLCQMIKFCFKIP